MSDFEDRVGAAAGQLIDARYEALKKLDPGLADLYLARANGGNKNAPKRFRVGADVVGGPRKAGSIVQGFGNFSIKDVNAIVDYVLRDKQITKEEEEALLIILKGQGQWTPGAKRYMIEQIEKNMKHLWSATPINANEAASFLKYADTIDFFSQGDRHKGTRLRYSPGDFLILADLIRQKQIGAWEVSAKRSYLRTPAGKRGADGFYLSSIGSPSLHDVLDLDDDRSHADDIYIVKGLPRPHREFVFAHEATHALQDFENLRSFAKFTETDAFIVQGFCALKFGMPYAAFPDRPEEVAYREAAPLLLVSASRRNDKWRSDFRKAYDKVVDAFIALVGVDDAEEPMDMAFEESERRQKEEKNLLQKMRRALQDKSKQRALRGRRRS